MRRTAMTILSLVIYLSCYSQSGELQIFKKGVSELKSENYQEAIRIFSQVLLETKDPGLQKFSHIYRAFAYNGIQDFNKSIADLDSAVIIDPKDIATFIDRGKTKGYARDLDGAKHDFKYVLTKDSTTEQGQAAFFYLGTIAYQQKQFKESIGWYDKFISLNTNDAEAYFNRGAAKGMLIPFDLEGSIKDYDMAIKLDPNYAEAYANRGTAKINLFTTRGVIQPTKEQTASACSDLKKAKALGDNNVDDMIFVYCDKK